MMTRRDLLQLLSALPLLGWLKPEPVDPGEWIDYCDVYCGDQLRFRGAFHDFLILKPETISDAELNAKLEDAMSQHKFIAPIRRVSINELEASDQFDQAAVRRLC